MARLTRACDAAAVALQELCTCPLRTVLRQRVLHTEVPTNPVRAASPSLSLAPTPTRRDSPRRRLRSSPEEPPPPRAGAAAQAPIVLLLWQVASGLEYLHSQGIIHGGAPAHPRSDEAGKATAAPPARPPPLRLPRHGRRKT